MCDSKRDSKWSDIKAPIIISVILMTVMFVWGSGYYENMPLNKLTQVSQAQAAEKLPGVLEELANNGTCVVYKTHIPNTENNIFVTCIYGTTKLQ